jgi:hypothetical protein
VAKAYVVMMSCVDGGGVGSTEGDGAGEEAERSKIMLKIRWSMELTNFVVWWDRAGRLLSVLIQS